MSKADIANREKTADPTDSLRLDPERRLCPLFDFTGIALFPVGKRERMGFRVVDDCCQEHIM